MRYAFMVSITAILIFVVGCASGERRGSAIQLRTVEAACATCIFEMEGVSGCKLAVKVDEKAYLVSGSEIDDHGDAHAADGLCNASREAVVQGKVEGDRFVASKFELKPGP